VELDCLLSYEEGTADPFVTVPLAQEGEDIAFTCGQIRESIGRFHLASPLGESGKPPTDRITGRDAVWGCQSALLRGSAHIDIEKLAPRYVDVNISFMNTSAMPKPRKRAQRDHVDRFLEGVNADLPADLDVEVEGIVNRIGGIYTRINWMHGETLDQLGLNITDWRTLTALHWAGKPYRRKVGELARHADLTSSAMTSRLDALEREGLVRRLRDPDDRRSVLIELTRKGRQTHEQGMGIQAQKETLIAAALTDREKKQLNALLRNIMVTLEDRYPGKHD
jgi:DNA-binding MarR family transcriptional regulator